MMVDISSVLITCRNPHLLLAPSVVPGLGHYNSSIAIQDYWQLPFWFILLEFVQAPIEIFTTFRGLPYLSYRAIIDNNVLSNDKRLKIYDYITNNHNLFNILIT